MSEPYTIRIFVPDGDPDGVKIVDRLNWTGVGIAFPRSAWPRVRARGEFRRTGIYILSGPTENAADDLPTIYVGQGDEIGSRLDSHYNAKDFWDWGYAFVSAGTALNRAHATWLEHGLIRLARQAERCHLENGNTPSEPNLSESDRADSNGFLREILRILPLLGVRVFERPEAVAPAEGISAPASETAAGDTRDTVVVPAREDGFRAVFLGEQSWHAIRISGGMLPRIKYIAAYQTAPVSAITHFAPVERIEPYGDAGKYRLTFSEPAKPLPSPIPFADAPQGFMQGPRYTSYAKLASAQRVTDLFAPNA